MRSGLLRVFFFFLKTGGLLFPLTPCVCAREVASDRFVGKERRRSLEALNTTEYFVHLASKEREG